MIYPFKITKKITKTFAQHVAGGSDYPGTDYSMVTNTPLYAPQLGTIRVATDQYGGKILDVKNDTWTFQNVHLEKFNKKTGDSVKEGDLVGYSGNTGLSTGPHLHFAVIDTKTKKRYDPELILNGLFNMADFKIGDKIEFMDTMNRRSGAGDKFPVTAAIAKGAVLTIKGGPRTSQNEQFNHGTNDSWTWYDTVDINGSTGWVAQTGRFVITTKTPTDVNGIIPTPEPPAPTAEQILQKRIDELTLENTGLKTELATVKEDNRVLIERNTQLQDSEALLRQLSSTIKKATTLYS